MPTVNITKFGGGKANDYTSPSIGESSISKHFDILTYPNRLQPLRGMTGSGEPANSLIGNMILTSDGAMYGIGLNPDTGTNGEIWIKSGFGLTDYWRQMTVRQNSGRVFSESAGHYDFFVHFPEMEAARKLFWSSTNYLNASNLPGDGSGSLSENALTFSTIGQGLVHPKKKILYFPYKTTTTHYIGQISSHASDPFGTVNYTAFALPFRYRAYCLSYYGDFLAIPLTTAVAGGKFSSLVYFWDMDTTNTLVSQSIPWGTGSLKVMNNLNGILIGISQENISSATSQDVDKITIRAYDGGSESVLIKELIVTRLTTTQPVCTLNYRVNYIYNDRLYFSCNLVGGGSNYYGLWSVGKNEFGRWTVVLERMATNDGSETSVIAACQAGDYISMVHTANGTITSSNNGNTLSDIYSATSVFESGINPEMSESDKEKRKQVLGVYATYLPLPDAAIVVMQYRVDSDADGSWTTCFTESVNNETRTERFYDSSGNKFTIGKKYEFRITSIGGAIITGYGYKYQNLATNI